MRHSIQWRLQAWHGGILLVALLAFLWVFHRAAWLEELRRVDAELGEQFELVLASSDGRPGPPDDRPGPPPDGRPGPRRPGPPPDGRPPDPRQRPAPSPRTDAIRAEIGRNIWQLESSRRARQRRDYYLFIDYDGTIFARSSNAPPKVPFPAVDRPRPRPSLIPGQANWESRSRGGYREVYRVLPLGDAIVIGRELDEESSRLLGQTAWVAFAGAGLWAAGLFGGWWFTRVALAPIGAISRTATEIASGDLSRRVDVAHADTELGQLAGVLNSTFARLQNSFDRQARFTSDASHELRTPISVILSKTQTTLNRERTSAEYQKALEVCQRAAERMRGLTESLLTLSRTDAAIQGAAGSSQEVVDLRAIAADAADFLAETAAAKGLTLQRELETAPIRGDAAQLGQVATNLLTNAIQHSPPGGTVTLRTYAAGAVGVLEVLDQGNGIDPQHLPHIFNRFYRAEESRTTAGYGLGLSIAQSIVTAHGGQITAANRQEGGAVFAVQVPLSAA